MSTDPAQLATVATWGMTGLGLGLWVWSWIGPKDPLGRQRFGDCAAVLVFASLLARIVIANRALSVLDWAMVVLGPIFIAAALWRLARTGGRAS